MAEAPRPVQEPPEIQRDIFSMCSDIVAPRVKSATTRRLGRFVELLVTRTSSPRGFSPTVATYLRRLCHPMDRDQLSLLRVFGALQLPGQYCSFVDVCSLQKFIVENILLSSHFEKYPPSRAYQRLFWKWIVARIEAEGEVWLGNFSGFGTKALTGISRKLMIEYTTVY